MISWFKNLNLLKKILVLSVLLLLGSMCWGAINSYLVYRVMADDVAMRNQFMVESMWNVVDSLEKRVNKGEITKEAAQTEVKEFIRQARYEGGKQYFWINDFDGQAVMHPIFPEFEGADLAQKNPKVHELFKGFAKALVDSKASGLVYEYMWPKPGGDKTVLFPKSSYIMQVPG